jgi:hypothetical protein
VGASNMQMLPEWNRFWYHTDCPSLLAQHTRANCAGRCTNRFRNLAKTCSLLSQSCHLVAIDYPARPSQCLSLKALRCAALP